MGLYNGLRSYKVIGQAVNEIAFWRKTYIITCPTPLSLPPQKVVSYRLTKPELHWLSRR